MARILTLLSDVTPVHISILLIHIMLNENMVKIDMTSSNHVRAGRSDVWDEIQ